MALKTPLNTLVSKS